MPSCSWQRTSIQGEREKANSLFEAALGIDPSFYCFGFIIPPQCLFLDEDKSGNVHAQVERVKLYTSNRTYLLGSAAGLQARVRYWQWRFEEGRSEDLRAVDIYEKLGTAKSEHE